MSKEKELYEKFKCFLRSQDFNFSENQEEMLHFVAKTFIYKEFHADDVFLENNNLKYYMRKDHYSTVISGLENDLNSSERYAERLEGDVSDLERDVRELQNNIDDAMYIINQHI